MIPKIQKVAFGDIIINGERFGEKDFFLFWDSVEATDKSHSPGVDELENMLLKEPDIVIFGTGFNNNVEISDEIKREAEKNKIELMILSTPDALKKFSEITRKGKRVAARIHVTC